MVHWVAHKKGCQTQPWARRQQKAPRSVVFHVYDRPGSPDDSRSNFSTKEYAECADCMRGEHADDGESHREFPVQGIAQNWREEEKIMKPTAHLSLARGTDTFYTTAYHKTTRVSVPVSWRRPYFPNTGLHRQALEKRKEKSCHVWAQRAARCWLEDFRRDLSSFPLKAEIMTTAYVGHNTTQRGSRQCESSNTVHCFNYRNVHVRYCWIVAFFLVQVWRHFQDFLNWIKLKCNYAKL